MPAGHVGLWATAVVVVVVVDCVFGDSAEGAVVLPPGGAVAGCVTVGSATVVSAPVPAESSLPQPIQRTAMDISSEAAARVRTRGTIEVGGRPGAIG
jgi:hypothetical protein